METKGAAADAHDRVPALHSGRVSWARSGKADSGSIARLRASFFDSDPLGRLLVSRLHVNTRLRALALGIAVGAITNILTPLLDGYFFARPGILSASQDWPGLLNVMVAVPWVYAYYCFEEPDNIIGLLRGFLTSKTLLAPGAEYDRSVERLRGWLTWRGWAPLAALWTLLIMYTHVRDVLSHTIPYYWNPNPAILYLLNEPLASFLPIYMVSMFVVRHGLVIVWLFEFFRKFKVHIYALHPDRCGGLSFIGHFAVRGLDLLGIFALSLSLLGLHTLLSQQNPLTSGSQIIAVAWYIVLAPLLFFLPLTPARRGMIEAKESARRLIADEADHVYESIESGLKNGRTDPAQIDSFQELNKLYDLTDKFPIWPLEITTLRRFLAATIIPILPSVAFEVSKIYFATILVDLARLMTGQ